MNPIVVAAVLVALVALATAIGLVWKATTGRSRKVAGSETVTISDLVPGATGGTAATLLQFSTEVCAPCVTTGALLRRLADSTPGVAHVDVDVTHRPDIARRFDLLQSPTTLVLDRHGVVQVRIGGAPKLPELRAEIDRLVGGVATGDPS